MRFCVCIVVVKNISVVVWYNQFRCTQLQAERKRERKKGDVSSLQDRG